MDFKAGTIDGVVVKELVKHRDERGWLAELFRVDEISKELHPVMGYVSETNPGISRGPHEHKEQTDYFCFLGPSRFKLYCWDTRKDSSTFGNRFVIEVGTSFPCIVVVPPGVVHAYKNIGNEPGWVINLPNRLYAGPNKKQEVDEIRHESDSGTKFIID